MKYEQLKSAYANAPKRIPGALTSLMLQILYKVNVCLTIIAAFDVNRLSLPWLI